VFEDSGHGASLQNACGRAMVVAYLQNPSAVDTSCAQNIRTQFQIPGAALWSLNGPAMKSAIRFIPASPFLRQHLRNLPRLSTKQQAKAAQ